jgi:hypothetical protein
VISCTCFAVLSPLASLIKTYLIFTVKVDIIYLYLSFSLWPDEKRSCCNFWPTIPFNVRDGAIHLRQQRNTTYPNALGAQKRCFHQLASQHVPPTSHLGPGRKIFKYVWRFNKFISLHGKKALKDVVRDMGWKSFTVLYQRDEALVRLQEVLKDHGPQDAPITVRQLPYGDDFRF